MKAPIFLMAAVALLATSTSVTAQYVHGGRTPRSIVDSIEMKSGGKIRIVQSPALQSIVFQDTVSTDAPDTTVRPGRRGVVKYGAGYRIQVYSDNKQHSARVRAQQLAQMIGSGFPDLGQYLTYNAPYWRLRVGDFATREDAQRVLEQLKQEYPRLAGEMRLVRDRIKYVE